MNYFFTLKNSYFKNNVTHFQYWIGFFQKGESYSFAHCLRQYMMSIQFLQKLLLFYSFDIFDIKVSSISSNPNLNEEITLILQKNLFLSYTLLTQNNQKNIKPLRFHLKRTGPGYILLEMIELPQNIFCITPLKKVCFLNKGEEVNLSFSLSSNTVYKKRGFFDQTQTPIDQISFFVEEVVTGADKIFEFITFNLWLKGNTSFQRVSTHLVKIALYGIAKKFLIFAATLEDGLHFLL